MTKKLLKLYLVGEKNKLCEVPCYDYDEEIGLARYQDVVYDIRTGRWVVTLSMIQKGFDTWLGCGSFPQITITKMLDTIKKNKIFMYRLEKQREKVIDAGAAETVNFTQLDLFSF